MKIGVRRIEIGKREPVEKARGRYDFLRFWWCVDGVRLFGLGLLGFAFGDAEEDFFESEGIFSEFDKFSSVADECFGDAAEVGGVGRHGDSDLPV